jgi:phage gpG-like protein
MFATLDGAEALDRRLADLPFLMRAQLETKAREQAATLVARIRDENLSGQVLATRSGALKASISAEVLNNGDTLTATIGSMGDVKYAAIQEYGGRTSAHEILPDKAHALAFLAGGALCFARRVNHPGSTLPARAYLLTSLEEASDEIVAAFSAAVTQAWDKP